MVSVFAINWCSQFFITEQLSDTNIFCSTIKAISYFRNKVVVYFKGKWFFFFFFFFYYRSLSTNFHCDEINNSTIYRGYHRSRTLEVVRNVFCRYYIRLDTSKQSYLNFSSQFTELKHLTKGIVFHLNLMYLNVFIVPADIYWMLDVFMTTRCCNIHYIN
jgi:hypothetical protein